MNILIAVDSFKGTLTSIEVAEVICENINPNQYNVDIIAIADGGEGTVDSLCYATKGQKYPVDVQDAFGEDKSSYFCVNKVKDTAMVEIALSSGLAYIDSKALNPYKTTSYGLGQTIKKTLDRGITKLVIGIGGSSSNDGGAGMLKALGVRFYDKDDIRIDEMNGFTIGDVNRIDITDLDSRLKEINIEVACDVSNPLLGPQGCAEVYSRQKGASDEMVKVLENNMKKYADVVEKTIKKDNRDLPGAGAAGGLGYGLVSFLGAHLTNGLDVVADATNLEKRIQKADLVITGEGSFDGQSLHGKAPVRIASIAKKHNIRCVGVFGLSSIKEKKELFETIYTVVPTVATKEESLANPKESLAKLIQLIEKQTGKS